MEFEIRELIALDKAEILAFVATDHTPQVKLFESLGWLPTEVAYKMSAE